MSATSIVGRIGTVGVAIRGGELPGEVRIVVEGLAHYYIAYCDQAVPEGQQVLVINSRGARRLDVEPWTGTGLDIADAFGTNERF